MLGELSMTQGNHRSSDRNLLLGCKPTNFATPFVNRRPKWVTGSLSHSDTRFLFRVTLECALDEVIEVGTGSGFSTAILCQALNWLHQASFIRRDFRVSSQHRSDR